MAEGARKQARLGSKLVLVVGFGAVLSLMAAAGIDLLHAVHHIEVQNAGITRQYIERHHSLEHIRSSLYLANTYVRDYVLAATPEDARAARIRLESLRKETLAALGSYYTSSLPDEAKLVSDLNRRVIEYWNELQPVFEWSIDQRQGERYRFLERRIFPQRASLLGIADRIDSVNEETLREGNARSAALFLSYRERMMAILALTLGLGLLFSAASAVYVLRLERESRVRLGEVQRLSARLLEAQEEERRSISRELHDAVGQSMNALLVELGNLVAVTPRENEQAHELLRTAKMLAEQNVKALRNMALLLRPSMLDDFGLVPALHWQAREMSRRTGIRIDVDADESADNLPEEHRTCVYRVVQEALHNASRHAGAKTVRIRVRQEARRIVVTVADDGRGFDPNLTRGLGLVGMEERVKHLRGRFEVRSRQTEGTIVEVDLPLEATRAEMTGAAAR